MHKGQSCLYVSLASLIYRPLGSLCISTTCYKTFVLWGETTYIPNSRVLLLLLQTTKNFIEVRKSHCNSCSPQHQISSFLYALMQKSNCKNDRKDFKVISKKKWHFYNCDPKLSRKLKLGLKNWHITTDYSSECPQFSHTWVPIHSSADSLFPRPF